MITNGDFETGNLNGWNANANAFIEGTLVQSGSWSAALRHRQGFAIPGVELGELDQVLAVEVGRVYQLDYWWMRPVGTHDTALEVGVHDQSHIYEPNDGTPGQWSLGSFTFLAAITNPPFGARLWDRTTPPPPTLLNEWFYLDSCAMQLVSGADMLTQTLLAAVLADLQLITTANGYATDLVTVAAKPRPDANLSRPAVIAMPAVGNATQESMQGRAGQAAQDFDLRIIIGPSAVPLADLMNLADDVRNVLEYNGQLLHTSVPGSGGVMGVSVSEWEFAATSEDIDSNTGQATATVRVIYSYTRGKL